MEWFLEKVSQLFEGFFWQSFLTRFHWVDWFTVGFILLGIVYGARKGFMRELVEILELILIIFLVFTYKDIVQGFLKSLLPSFTDRTLEAAVLILTALAFWFLIAFADGYLQKTIHAKATPGLKVIGGAILGGAHFLILWSLISQVIVALPMVSLARIYEPGASISGEPVRRLAPFVYEVLQKPSQHLSGAKA